VKVAAVGVGLPADLRPADTARVIVLIAARQDEQELLPHGCGLLAADAEEARRLQLAKAVYHALTLDQGGVGRFMVRVVEPDRRGHGLQDTAEAVRWHRPR
jgi:hypothetical protein